MNAIKKVKKFLDEPSEIAFNKLILDTMEKELLN